MCPDGVVVASSGTAKLLNACGRSELKAQESAVVNS